MGFSTAWIRELDPGRFYCNLIIIMLAFYTANPVLMFRYYLADFHKDSNALQRRLSFSGNRESPPPGKRLPEY